MIAATMSGFGQSPRLDLLNSMRFKIHKHMNIIEKHIGLTIIKSILMVMLVFVGVQIFITFVNELKDIGTGYYNMWHVIEYVFLTLPEEFYRFFPMVCLIGSLWGLGHLASHSELIAARAAGVSIGKIIRIVLKAALFLLIIVTLVGEFLGPAATRKAETQKSIAKSKGTMLQTNNGLWLRHSDTFIHIKRMIPGIRLAGITQYQFDRQNHLTSISYAPNAFFKKNYWVLNNIRTTKFGTKKTMSQIQKEITWSRNITPDIVNASKVNTDEISLFTLYKIIRYLHHNGLQTGFYLSAFCGRLIQPISCLIMTFLAIPFILGPLRAKTMGLRLLTGIGFGFAFYLLNQFFGSVGSVYHLPPAVSVLVPSLLFLLIGVWLVRKV